MFLNKDSIIINNVSFGRYITQAEYQYNKIWGEDAGTGLSGDFSGTLLGIRPKFVLQFKPLTKDQMEIIAPILDSTSQNFTYYDPVKQSNITISTYTGDWSFINKNIVGANYRNEGFQISFISRKRRTQ